MLKGSHQSSSSGWESDIDLTWKRNTEVAGCEKWTNSSVDVLSWWCTQTGSPAIDQHSCRGALSCAEVLCTKFNLELFFTLHSYKHFYLNLFSLFCYDFRFFLVPGTWQSLSQQTHKTHCVIKFTAELLTNHPTTATVMATRHWQVTHLINNIDDGLSSAMKYCVP